MVTRSNNNKLKQLNLNPLSVAKYFYQKLGERGVEQTFIQPITYLTCQEILKKEGLLLFSEKFQTGPASPVLLSLRDIIRKHGDHLDTFFSQIPDITNSQVLIHLEKLAKKHANSFGFEVQYQAQKRSGLTI